MSVFLFFKQKEGKEPFQLDLAVWREGEVTLFMPGFQYKEGFQTKVYSAVRKRGETKAK